MTAILHRQLVRQFYDVMWNQWNVETGRRILTMDVAFDGSMGVSTEGLADFFGYMDLIRRAFPDFRSHMETLVADNGGASARLMYTGTHQGDLPGLPATGREISYAGAAFFEFRQMRICKVWVLGDREALLEQLS